MKILKEIVASPQTKRISDYFALNRKIGLALDNNEVLVDREIRIAILCSFTINGVKDILRVQCGELNILADIYAGEYNQYAQEILDPASGLYQFNPDLVIVYLDTRAIAGDYYFLPYDKSEKERRSWVDETVREMTNLVEKVCEELPAKILVHNLEVPVYSPLGLMESKEEFGFVESIELVNRGLRERFRKNSQVFVFDYDSFCARIGKENILDYKMYYLGDIKLKTQNMPMLCKEYMRYVRALTYSPLKCIVLDLDNTLWGGIVGECGMEGVHLGPTPEGRPFLEFQKYLLSLCRRGIILAINSKNNYDDAIEVILNHPHMVLKENQFAAIRINWDDKVSNIKSIASELNIGLDSLVFFDDDDLNREMVRGLIPEIMVVDMPKDPSLYVDTLVGLSCFDSLTLTEEDKKKGTMYSEEKKRREFAESTTDLTEYLRMLAITLNIEKISKRVVPRVSQLTQKTNQFNTTTRRYTEEAITGLVESDKFNVISLHYSDKFGDSGLTGLAIVDIEDCGRWRIDTFLLSCRIIGRGTEEALLSYIINEAKIKGVRILCGEFISTRKNAPARKFYEKAGFSKVRNVGDMEIWEYNLAEDYPCPDFVSLKF